MTARTESIVSAILQVLHGMEDGQCAEGVLKSSVDLLVTPNTLKAEFDEAVLFAEARKWIIGLRTDFGAVKWSITDSGTARHLKNVQR
jgi:hypothetical protein